MATSMNATWTQQLLSGGAVDAVCISTLAHLLPLLLFMQPITPTPFLLQLPWRSVQAVGNGVWVYADRDGDEGHLYVSKGLAATTWEKTKSVHGSSIAPLVSTRAEFWVAELKAGRRWLLFVRCVVDGGNDVFYPHAPPSPSPSFCPSGAGLFGGALCWRPLLRLCPAHPFAARVHVGRRQGLEGHWRSYRPLVYFLALFLGACDGGVGDAVLGDIDGSTDIFVVHHLRDVCARCVPLSSPHVASFYCF